MVRLARQRLGVGVTQLLQRDAVGPHDRDGRDGRAQVLRDGHGRDAGAGREQEDKLDVTNSRYIIKLI
ncbi:hypothetical protein RC55_13735 [Herbaspirillum seropedicae]|nr:hypothetical protein ACP92_18745 [Herbaspirillum seropedicae]NQE30311.1 hypothetical protein [Herbaspirillum seropedicae]